MRSTVEEQERIKLQSPHNAKPKKIVVRIASGDDLSLSQAARQLVNQRKSADKMARTPVVSEIIWGGEAIAPYLGRTTKGTFGALESGRVPGASKIAGRWGLSLKVFFAHFDIK